MKGSILVGKGGLWFLSESCWWVQCLHHFQKAREVTPTEIPSGNNLRKCVLMLIFALKLGMPINHSDPFSEERGVGVICERADGDYGMFKPLQTAFRSHSAAQDGCSVG